MYSVVDVSVTPYDPNSRFTTEALSRLTERGIPVLRFLSINIKSFRHLLGFSEPVIYTHYNLALVLNSWMRGFSNVPPTWRNLLLVIRQLNLDSLGQLTETYLSGRIVKEPTITRESEVIIAGEGERIM